VAISEKAVGPDHSEAAITLNNLALLYRHQARYAEAERLWRRALAINEKAFGPDHPGVARSLDNLADLCLVQGQIQQALSASARAVDILQKHLAVGKTQRSGGAITEQRSARRYFANYIRIGYAAGANAPEGQASAAATTFHVVQLAQASEAAQAVGGMAARFAAGSDALAAAVRERQDLTYRGQRLDADIVKAVSRPPPERNPAQEAALRAAFEETTRRLDTLDARFATEFPAYDELSNPRPVSIEVTQSLLAGDEALLVYLTSVDETWLWVVRRDAVAFHRLEIGAQVLAHEVMALRGRLDPELNADRAPFPADRAYALFQKLIAPAAPELAGVRHLLVVPDGALQSLPLGVLVTRSPEHDLETLAGHRDIAWLARDYAMTVLPSVSSLQALRRIGAGATTAQPFLGVGDPVLQGRDGRRPKVKLVSLFRGALADADQVRALPPLPETADELRAIARSLGAAETDLLLGERASEPVLRQTPLDHYRVVAFATHGLLSGELPGLAEPALVLTPPAEATPENDGLLTASKIATLKLNADWVVLSACNTAAGDGTPDGGGLSGLAKAFFYAGARSLLVSHWPVSSQATVKLTTGAFAELAKDPTIGRAEALRRSMMAMLDPANPTEFAHPLAWAPFVLAGESGSAR
jgi:CHAT domain-containing protein